jgi:hypothetical protein
MTTKVPQGCYIPGTSVSSFLDSDNSLDGKYSPEIEANLKERRSRGMSKGSQPLDFRQNRSRADSNNSPKTWRSLSAMSDKSDPITLPNIPDKLSKPDEGYQYGRYLDTPPPTPRANTPDTSFASQYAAAEKIEQTIGIERSKTVGSFSVSDGLLSRRQTKQPNASQQWSSTGASLTPAGSSFSERPPTLLEAYINDRRRSQPGGDTNERGSPSTTSSTAWRPAPASWRT